MKKLMLLTLVLFYTANSFCLPNYIKCLIIATVAYFTGYSARAPLQKCNADLALCTSQRDACLVLQEDVQQWKKSCPLNNDNLLGLDKTENDRYMCVKMF